MIQAILPIGQGYDSEYLAIIQELRKYGLSPSGNKGVDRGRLAQAKKEFVEKLQERFNMENSEHTEISPERLSLEEQRPGAMAVAQLNRVLLGI